MDGNFLMHMVLVEHEQKRELERTRINPDIQPGMARPFRPAELLRDFLKR